MVFNQVLNFNIDTGSSVTVPEGKVWKIVSGVTQGEVQFYSTNQDYGNDLNASNSNGYAIQSFQKPFWLGQGNTIARTSGSAGAVFSILEFNVVAISSSSGGSGGGVSADGLKFSQVINYSGTYNFPTNYTGHIYETFEIPEGKVWKITSVTVAKMQGVNSTYDTAVRPSSAVGVQLGGIVIHLVSGGGAAYPEVHPINDTWINSGSKELFVTSYGANTKVSFTAIEYTIPE